MGAPSGRSSRERRCQTQVYLFVCLFVCSPGGSFTTAGKGAPPSGNHRMLARELSLGVPREKDGVKHKFVCLLFVPLAAALKQLARNSLKRQLQDAGEGALSGRSSREGWRQTQVYLFVGSSVPLAAALKQLARGSPKRQPPQDAGKGAFSRRPSREGWPQTQVYLFVRLFP